MKTFLALSFFLFQILLLVVHANAVDSGSNNKTKPSALEFFKQFQGSQKGDKVKGINELKKYLQTLGYINIQNNTFDDYFDETLKTAIKTYQINFNLNATGTLDLKTVSNMAEPRCGFPDIIDGRTRMHSSSFRYDTRYAFFKGSPRWPLNKKTLTYAFQPGTRADAHEPVRVALLQWSNWVPFTFQGSDDYEHADIKINFQHMDGPGNRLAYAYAPTNGTVHFDAEEKWVLGAVPGGFDIMTVALHELGHVLGLDHSSVEAAIMWPTTDPGRTKDLNDDDIQGIKKLYS